MDGIAEFCNKYQFAFALAAAAGGPFAAWLFTRSGWKLAAWWANVVAVAFLLGILAVDKFQPVPQTFDVGFPPDVADGHQGQEPPDDTMQERQPMLDGSELLGDVSVDSLNRSRLAGKWARVGARSYSWVSHAIILQIPVPGGTLVNSSDTYWKFQPDNWKQVQKADGTYAPVPPP